MKLKESKFIFTTNVFFKSKLKLVTAIQSMGYETIGKRDWIQEKNIIKEVEQGYIDCLIELPHFEDFLQENHRGYKAAREELSNNRTNKSETLDDLLRKGELNDGEYKKQIEEIGRNFDKKNKELIRNSLLVRN